MITSKWSGMWQIVGDLGNLPEPSNIIPINPIVGLDGAGFARYLEVAAKLVGN